MKNVVVAVLLLLAIAGCSRTPSNVHVIATSNCGAKWEKLSVGSTVPKHTGNPCGYNVALPNWPMAGDTQFKTQFSKKVLSNAKMSYTYTITDPLLFINEARYLGKMGGSLELSSDTVGSRYEMAENIIIDKMLREVTTELTRDLDVVDANPAEIEDAILKQAKDTLEKKGIVLSDLALVIENDDLTRLAIDAATAIRVYEAAGIRTVGESVMTARAGATKIQVITASEHNSEQ
jgi:hypothetical protein